MSSTSGTKPLLTVDDLHVSFRTDDGSIRAVNGVSFELHPGETLGIVGESGSGKSVTNLALLGLIPRPPGVIERGRAMFAGQDLLKLGTRELSSIRGKRIAMIFQDPMTALNPFLSVAEQLTEVTQLHLKHSSSQARKHAIDMLERVGIPAAAERIDDFPHQFSGGMRQRVMIAMALACQPEILIADEPTTALDVTIQAQMLELIAELQKTHGTAVILITHALGVIASVCHRVLVMYAGKIVEQAGVYELFAQPQHPYTLGLLKSIPRWDATRQDQLAAIDGQPPDMLHPPTGCAFHPRCTFRLERCSQEEPPLEPAIHGGLKACFADLTKIPSPTEQARAAGTHS
ncbi:Oligopeptide transport ATP-binding protein OppD [Anatilimnocola aggregata]|uniref:Oligopeptide transport ATP-binding protein OppD n=1 Tax=Anatilimnocola aggregata TaxID=2528021 RepID=A0A517Y8A7_9BACT|nr:Oligopeptide transport ATP-binding protein OppD [Anatilimnocola aggregata]